MKTICEHFRDWESHVFGYGYGTGEIHVLRALFAFFGACDEGENHRYNYETLEYRLGPTVAWLLINALAHADIIEYGTSPRFGWLTPQGKRLFDFVRANDPESLVELTSHDEGYSECYPDHCNCDDGPCHNPFWHSRAK